VLSAAGALNPKMYGQPVVTKLSADEREAMRDMTMWPVTSDASEHDRRSVYLFMKRSFPLPMLGTFDAPDTGESCPRRGATDCRPTGAGADEQRVDGAAGAAVRGAGGEGRRSGGRGVANRSRPSTGGGGADAGGRVPAAPQPRDVAPVPADLQHERVSVCQLSS